MSSEPTSVIPPGYQFRLWHLFAAVTWTAVVMAFFALDEYWPLGVMFIAVTLGVIALRARSLAGGIFAGLLLAVSLVLPVTKFTPKAAHSRTLCANHLKQLALALHQYHADYGSFPPAYVADQNGKPMHSWRVLILPYLDQQKLYTKYRFDEPWDGPNNIKLQGTVVSQFVCPGDDWDAPRTHTSFVAVLGDDTIWPYAKCVKFRQLRDGASNTLQLVELHDSGIHWMEPRDTTVEWCLAGTEGPLAGGRPGRKANHREESVVAFADGQIEFLPYSTTPDELRRMLTIDSRKSTERGTTAVNGD